MTNPARPRVAIVGLAEQWDDIPDGFEWWGMNTGYHKQPESKFSLWFELHPLEDMYDNLEHDPKHIEWVEGEGREVELVVLPCEEARQLPNTRVLPANKIIETYGSYITNSVSWMIAYALMQGAAEIGLYGLNMEVDYEFKYERPSIEYFIGYARGKGVEVHVPDESSLTKTPCIYGVDQLQDMYPVLRRRAWEYRTAAQRSRSRAAELQGAADEAQGLADLYAMGREPGVAGKKARSPLKLDHADRLALFTKGVK